MNKKRKELIISVTGVLLLLLSAVFCYQTVRDAIINNEKESIQNIAEVSSHSLKATLQGKSNLVYAALSGDMASEENIYKNGEKPFAMIICDVWIKSVNCKTGNQIPARRQEKIQDTLLQDQ